MGGEGGYNDIYTSFLIFLFLNDKTVVYDDGGVGSHKISHFFRHRKCKTPIHTCEDLTFVCSWFFRNPIFF